MKHKNNDARNFLIFVVIFAASVWLIDLYIGDRGAAGVLTDSITKYLENRR